MSFEDHPLHSLEVEAAVLSWMLRYDGAKLLSIAHGLRPEMFYFQAHRQVFRLLAAQAQKDKTCDLVKLKADLIRLGELDGVGGEPFLFGLGESAFFAVGSPEKAKQIVQELWSLRELEKIGTQIQQSARSEAEFADVIAGARRLLKSAVFATGGKVPEISEIELDDEDERGVPTPYELLNSTLGSGMVKGQTYPVCAYHKGGKTAFLIGLALHALDQNLNAVYVTLADLDKRQLKRRMLRQRCGWSKRPFSSLQDQAGFDDALGYLNDAFRDGALRVYEGSVHGRYVEDIAAKMAELQLDRPIDLLVVDYIQKCRSRERGARDGKTAELEYVSDHLKSMAEELNCPIPVGSQITEGQPGKQTTKYARGIEEDAGAVIHVDLNPETKRVEIRVPFNRFGPARKMSMYWNESKLRVEA